MTETSKENLAARQVLSPEELAGYLGCGRTYAYALLAKGPEGGGIRSFKLGRLRKVLRTDADEFIRQRIASTNSSTKQSVH